jgi:peptidoglycan/xylan/chitin deacetylase (PgdA/CDA1 family)
MRSLPVFMYHHINWHLGDLVTLTPEDFENHLRVLSEKGVQPLFLNEVVEYLRGEKGLSRPAVALTFDDGHMDNWVYAFPLLKKYGLKATIFVITSWMADGAKRNHWLGEEGVDSLPAIPTHRESKRRAARGDFSFGLRWAEAEAMEASGCVDIQSHTHWHRDYFLADGQAPRLNPEERGHLVEDLTRSKELIEERLVKKCKFLSWPWGKYDAEGVTLARKVGFEAMVTTEKGVNLPGSSETTIKRIVAKSGDRGWFAKRLQIYSHPTIGRIYSRLAGKI